MYDVIIIGSGVAGSTAAYFLAEAGAKVLVLEKDKLPRYKTCGGGVVHRAVNLLPFSIDENVERKLMSVDIFDQENSLHFHVNRDLPLISMVMRKDLDYFILKKAVEKGATVLDNIPVEDIQINSGDVYAMAAKENFKARFLIGADGATGITAQKVDAQFNCKKIPAIECEIEINKKN